MMPHDFADTEEERDGQGSGEMQSISVTSFLHVIAIYAGKRQDGKT
jgi:hypothetical protein